LRPVGTVAPWATVTRAALPHSRIVAPMTAAKAAARLASPQREDRLERMTPSAIREVHNLAVRLRAEHPERPFIALHFGEGDLGTPEFIVEAGVQALRDGAVFYENNAGRPDLTAALAAHFNARLGLRLEPGHFVVTCGGVQAILLTMLGLLAPGDDVINITPAWPNFREAAVIAGAHVHDLALRFESRDEAFHLHLGELERLGAGLERLRLVVVNSPSNPTGYVASAEEQAALLAFCRRHEAVLLADEMYERIVFREPAPPSFLQQAGPGERLVVINGFSKTYAMTGWRLGYLIAEPALAARLAQMQEFVTSCAPAMAQVAALTALRDGESYAQESRARYRRLRDLVLERLRGIPGVTVARPDGAFYAFFRAPGSADSLGFCTDFLRASGVALAPGRAFGAGGEGWLRLCFAKEPALLEQALAHLERYIASR
jgi:aspartate/methionine/tyrosine aminotransferase